MTTRELSLRMGARELGRWRKYAAQRGFASERLQWQLALLSYMVASAFGSGNLKLSDFLVRFTTPETPAESVTTEQGASMLSSMSGRGVRVLGQKRKHRKKE